jgi:hypothetical protein
MRTLGILAAICVVVSFLLWLTNWLGWTFLYPATYSGSPWMATVLQVIGFVANMLELLAILFLAIGLIAASKKQI